MTNNTQLAEYLEELWRRLYRDGHALDAGQVRLAARRLKAAERPLTTSEAVEVLNIYGHEQSSLWRLRGGLVQNEDGESRKLSEFEAVAVAEKLEREQGGAA